MDRKFLLLLCIFLGWLGAHKFAEKKYAMGFLYLFTVGVFYVGWIRDIYLLATNKYDSLSNNDYVNDAIMNNILPVLQADSLMLREGEICHFHSKAFVETSSTVQSGYTMSGSSRDSIVDFLDEKVSKASVDPKYKTVKNKYTGHFLITNMRIIFLNQQKGFECSLGDLTAIMPGRNEITIQTVNNSECLHMKNAPVVLKIVQMIQNSRK